MENLAVVQIDVLLPVRTAAVVVEPDFIAERGNQGRFLQLAGVLGVEKETGFTLNYDKYNWDEHRDHFILADCPDHDMDFGEGKKSIYALEGTDILIQRDKEVQLAAHDYGQGRGVYISGLPYSFANSRALYRAILWAAHSEDELHTWFSSNYNVEVHAYVKNGKYCVVNNTLRAPGHHRLHHRRRQLRAASGGQRDPLVRDRLSGAPPGFHGLCPQRLRALRPLQNSRPNRQTPLTIRRRKVKLKEKQGAGPEALPFIFGKPVEMQGRKA